MTLLVVLTIASAAIVGLVVLTRSAAPARPPIQSFLDMASAALQRDDQKFLSYLRPRDRQLLLAHGGTLRNTRDAVREFWLRRRGTPEDLATGFDRLYPPWEDAISAAQLHPESNSIVMYLNFWPGERYRLTAHFEKETIEQNFATIDGVLDIEGPDPYRPQEWISRDRPMFRLRMVSDERTWKPYCLLGGLGNAVLPPDCTSDILSRLQRWHGVILQSPQGNWFAVDLGDVVNYYDRIMSSR